MQLIDSHCHINDKQFEIDLADVIGRASDAGVVQMICIGTDIKSSERAIEIADKYSNVFATCGIHPHDSDKPDKKYIQILEEFSTHEKVVAIGEMGLDYFYDFSDKKIQKIVFREQLELAKELNLPAVIHNRESDADLFNIIQLAKLHNGVVHCFASDIEFANKLIDIGLHVSFTGMVTFVKSLHDVIEKIDINKIMIETDSPYLSPKPHRGKRNEPAFVGNIVNTIAELKNIDPQSVALRTIETTRDFFNLPSD
ncbi:MAG: TatD family hydrolase [Candidatus Marinimicrobia bacterium]|nr:TatD family hydrolase [Candidatus Neomarinimicrobiota bacterium]